jgi:hypothetical protein
MKKLPLGLYYEIINIDSNNNIYRVVSNIPLINNLRSNIGENSEQFIERIYNLVKNEFINFKFI